MELKYSPTSPFARKVLVVAHEVGVADGITLTRVDLRADRQTLEALNPLTKIPVLIADDGAVIYDSPVICEYLDTTHGAQRLLPAHGAQRWQIMTRVALADGMLDAAILVRTERLRAKEQQSPDWIDRQMSKVEAALDTFARSVPPNDKALDMGDIALGCALGYLPLRLPELVGYPKRPALRALYDRLCERASFARTMPSA